ncbi:MAG: hypothetical protein AAF456_16355 [Planctomycetota bacterium]
MIGSKIYVVLALFACLVFGNCGGEPDPQALPVLAPPETQSGGVARMQEAEEEYRTPDALALDGTPLFAAEPSEQLRRRYRRKKDAYDEDRMNADNIVWYGRFTAYLGEYYSAIVIYSRGISLFPEDARMLRHRGHRLITIRQFDEAIVDLENAVQLIEGKENVIEPDGMPNPQNIPVTTLHGNIWYHLGLAYYLKQDFVNARRCFMNCLDTAERHDNIVSSTHWLYMIHRRLCDDDEAEQCLASIESEMDVIENHSYHKLCQFYKGLITLEELEAARGDGPERDSIDYGIANWFLYSGETDKAIERFKELTSRNSWMSFGYIAAEADLYAVETATTGKHSGE